MGRYYLAIKQPSVCTSFGFALLLLSFLSCTSLIGNGDENQNAKSDNANNDDQSMGEAVAPDPASIYIDLPPDIDIGEFDLEAPQGVNEFVLKGNLPIPRGVYPLQDPTKNPFFIEDADGAFIPTQVKIVDRYSDDFAAVVELRARVRNQPPNGQGRIRYKIRTGVSTPSLPSPDASPRELLAQVEDLPQSIVNFLLQNQPLELIAYDFEDRAHRVDLLSEQSAWRLERYGPHSVTIRSYGTMIPTGSGTLPNLFGVMAFITSNAATEALEVNLIINNGSTEQGGIKNVGRGYFKSLVLNTPGGWQVLNKFDDPFFRPCPSNSNYPCSGQPIVDSINNGSYNDNTFFSSDDNDLHVISILGWVIRWLAISPNTTQGNLQAQQLLGNYGQSFAVRGIGSNGDDYFSWWNPLSSNYLAHGVLPPDVSNLAGGNVAIRNSIKGDFNKLKNIRKNGNDDANEKVFVKNCGHGHPYDQKNGGGTGGALIHPNEGLPTLTSGERTGISRLQLLMEMTSTRQSNALIQPNGEPFDYNDFHFIAANGLEQRTYKTFDMRPKHPQGNNWAYNWPPTNASTGSADDPFGVTRSLKQTPDIGSRKPGYEADYLGNATSGGTNHYSPYDAAHHIRYHKNLKALTWLANDDIARYLLIHYASLAMATYDPAPFNPNNLAQADIQSMVKDVLKVAQKGANNASIPNSAKIAELINLQQGGAISTPQRRGFDFGRAKVWKLDVAANAYRVADDSWRAKHKRWFGWVTELVNGGVSDCSGMLLSKTTNKFQYGLDLNAQEGGQAIEVSYGVTALSSVYKGVWQYLDAAKAQKALETLSLSGSALYTTMWKHGSDKSVYSYVGVQDPVNSLFFYFGSGSPPSQCTGTIIPSGMDSPIVADSTEGGASRGVIMTLYELTGDPLFRNKAAKMQGITSPAQMSDVQVFQGIVNNLENDANMQPDKALESFFQFGGVMLGRAQLEAGLL